MTIQNAVLNDYSQLFLDFLDFAFLGGGREKIASYQSVSFQAGAQQR